MMTTIPPRGDGQGAAVPLRPVARLRAAPRPPAKPAVGDPVWVERRRPLEPREKRLGERAAQVPGEPSSEERRAREERSVR